MKILHIISGLGTGGSERLLADLLKNLEHNDFECSVVVLSTHVGPIIAEIQHRAVSVDIYPLNQGMIRAVKGILNLLKLLRRTRPSVVQTWMYHADLIGGTLAKLVTSAAVFWGVFADKVHPDTNWKTKLIIRICAFLSPMIPDRIICCSERSRRSHIEQGYCSNKLDVINAGIDLNRFVPNAQAAGVLREQLGVTANTELVGMVARFSLEKDHRNFAKAAAYIAKVRPDVRFVLCGQGIVPTNRELVAMLREEKVDDRVFLIGHQADIVPILQGLTLSMLSSSNESFGLVMAEALACGIMSVGTDVGEVRRILGDSRFIVPPHQPAALGSACLTALSLAEEERIHLMEKIRAQLRKEYDCIGMTKQYKSLWNNFATQSL